MRSNKHRLYLSAAAAAITLGLGAVNASAQVPASVQAPQSVPGIVPPQIQAAALPPPGVPGTVAQQALPGNVVGNNSVDMGAGTLRRIEQLYREQAEADIRNKAAATRGAAGGTPLPGFAPANGAQAGTSFGALPAALAPSVQPSSRTAPQSSTDAGQADLVSYQTMTVLNIGDDYVAEVSRDGIPHKVTVGADLEGWKVSKISLDGVFVQKTITSYVKKKKVTKVRTEKLANYREGATNVVASAPPAAVAPTTPVGKQGMPDSTNVSIARPN